MRIIEGFRLRNVLGENVVVGEGVKQINFNKLISLNESAALLWKNIEGKDFTNESLAALLVENYEIEYETALHDAEEMTRQWIELGIVEA